MTLTFREPPTNDGKFTFNVLLYGPPKTGKTGGAATAPGQLLYANADLENASRIAHAVAGERMNEVVVEGLSTMTEMIHLLSSKEPGIDTVVVDTCSDFHRKILSSQSNDAIRPTMNVRMDVSVYLERFYRKLCELPINTVFVAHALTIEPDGDGESIPAEVLPNMGTKSNTASLGKKLAGMVDIIGYTGRVEDDDGVASYVAQLIPAKGRLGGDRYDVLGTVRTLDLSEWHTLCAASPVALGLNTNNKEQVAA